MYKNIFFLLLILIAGAGSAFAFSQTGQSEDHAVSTVDETPTPANANATFSQEQDGIEVTIGNIQQKNDSTVLTLSLNNHQFNLGLDAIYENATLNGESPQSYALPSNAVGGHHVEATISFERTTSGAFVITPVEGTTFTFNDLWE